MSSKKKLLIINRDQFAYHIDTYYYSVYANDEFDIVYCGFDGGRPKFSVPNVRCVYVPRRGNILARYFRLMRSYLRECRKSYDVIFIEYFVGCSILRLLNPSKSFVMDIRTGSIYLNPAKRWWMDVVMRFESLFFGHISVISASLADKLRLQKRKVHILPLGADPVDVPAKKYDSLHLLYVGTFSHRRIEDTIKGLKEFHSEYGGSIDLTYDIIGDGYNDELEYLRNLVAELGMEHMISLPGYIYQSDLKDYYERCNVGVSYIPINDIYDCQPPTKTYEYLLAGMPVIGTSTFENRRVINSSNGVLVNDSPAAFCEGLKSLYRSRREFCSERIRRSNLKYSWREVVKNEFLPYIQDVAAGRGAG